MYLWKRKWERKSIMASNRTLIVMLIVLFAGAAPVRSGETHDSAKEGNLDKVKSLLAESGPNVVGTLRDKSSGLTLNAQLTPTLGEEAAKKTKVVMLFGDMAKPEIHTLVSEFEWTPPIGVQQSPVSVWIPYMWETTVTVRLNGKKIWSRSGTGENIKSPPLSLGKPKDGKVNLSIAVASEIRQGKAQGGVENVLLVSHNATIDRLISILQGGTFLDPVFKKLMSLNEDYVKLSISLMRQKKYESTERVQLAAQAIISTCSASGSICHFRRYLVWSRAKKWGASKQFINLFELAAQQSRDLMSSSVLASELSEPNVSASREEIKNAVRAAIDAMPQKEFEYIRNLSVSLGGHNKLIAEGIRLVTEFASTVPEPENLSESDVDTLISKSNRLVPFGNLCRIATGLELLFTTYVATDEICQELTNELAQIERDLLAKQNVDFRIRQVKSKLEALLEKQKAAEKKVSETQSGPGLNNK